MYGFDRRQIDAIMQNWLILQDLIVFIKLFLSTPIKFC